MISVNNAEEHSFCDLKILFKLALGVTEYDTVSLGVAPGCCCGIEILESFVNIKEDKGAVGF